MGAMVKDTILYTHSVKSSFVRKDLELLESNFQVRKFYFDPSSKPLTTIIFLKQFFYLLWNLKRTSLYITQFAGYQSFLPALFSRIFKKPSLIVLGGSDCVSFASFKYGNFNKKLLGRFTKWSYNYSSHLAPVADELIYGEWTYYPVDGQFQGVKVFAPKAKIDYRVIPYGYSSDLFKRTHEKIENTFLMVGYLNSANYYRKGVDMIISLAKAKPELKFTIIGGAAEDLPDVQIPTNITMIKSLSYEELQNYYSQFKYYLQISICEGFPSALCEAMLCECIPIVSDVAAMPHIVGETGYILKKRSESEFERLVERILSHSNSSKAHDCRARIIEHYPLNRRQELIDYIKEIIGN